MDVLSIARAIWRHKLLSLPLLLLTAVAGAYVLVLAPPKYQVTANYALVFPPAAPTPLQLKQDPALATASANNPFLRFSDQSIVAQVISDDLVGDLERQTLIAEGADRNYTVAPSAAYGSSQPIVEVTANGTSAAGAAHSEAVVGAALHAQLRILQARDGASPFYFVTALRVDDNLPKMVISSRLRSGLALVAGGLILLFMLVSSADALETRRARARIEALGTAQTGTDDRIVDRPTSIERPGTPGPYPTGGALQVFQLGS